MKWFRAYHDMPSHPRLRLIAHRAGTSVSNALSVWMTMLCHASRQTGEARGTLHGWDDTECALLLGIGEEVVFCIRREMEGRYLDGQRITGWEERQSSRDDSAERVRRWRAKQRETVPSDSASNPNDASVMQHEATQRALFVPETINANQQVTDDVTRYSVTVTPCNEQNRREEIRDIVEAKASTHPKPRKRASGAGPDFEIFWSLFPRKVGKGAAERAWPRAVVEAGGADEIVFALRQQIDGRHPTVAPKNGPEFIPYPATYLNQRRWLDGAQQEQHAA